MVQLKNLKTLFSNGSNTHYVRNKGLLHLTIITQSMAALRNIRPRNYWRYRKDNSGIDEVYRQTNILQRKFEPVTAIFIVINHGNISNKKSEAMEEDEAEHSFVIDLAEAIRLGEHFKIDDGDENLDFKFTLPRPSDVYEWNGSLYEIEGIAPEYFYEPLQRHVTWKGAARLFRTDSADPDLPLKPLGLPELKNHPMWVV